MARPPLEINEDQVFELAKIMCTHKEIAAVMRCSTDTIASRYSDLIKKGHEVGRMSLRRKQWKLADKNAAMCIWLGKQYLGQSDKVEQTDNVYLNERIEFVTEEQKTQGRDALSQFLSN